MPRGYSNILESVVRKMYDAIQERDQDKYIDCLAPESRMMPGFFFWDHMTRAGVGVVMIFQPRECYSLESKVPF